MFLAEIDQCLNVFFLTIIVVENKNASSFSKKVLKKQTFSVTKIIEFFLMLQFSWDSWDNPFSPSSEPRSETSLFHELYLLKNIIFKISKLMFLICKTNWGYNKFYRKVQRQL